MEKIVVFGTGKVFRELCESEFLDAYNVVGIIDNNKSKWGENFRRKIVYPPEKLLEWEYDKVLIAVFEYKEIEKQLIEKLNVLPEQILSIWDVPEIIYKKIGKTSDFLSWHHLPMMKVPDFVISSGEEGIEDDSLIRRIGNAYNICMEKFQAEGESCWTTGGLWECKRDVHEKLVCKDWDAVKYALRKPATNNLFAGFESIVQNNTHTTEEEIRLVYDVAIQLAAFWGVIRMPYFEKIDLRHFNMNFDELFDGIERKLGINLKFPNPYPGEVGIKTKRGIVNYRSLHALYQAYRICELVKGNADAKVLEIGAGLGRTAYFAYQMGVKNYTIIDIPMTNVAQAYFLGRTLGEDNVALVGENGMGKVRIFPTYMLWEAEQDYDLIVNVDSMTEMDEKFQKDYWEYIKKHTNIFLSINHEFNEHTISEYYEKSNCKVKRYLYPIRKGYLEEEIYFNKK